jgi:uncharacterized protein YprB with RNaseH-like and TPR domain
MLTQAIRDRIGGLLRAGKLDGGARNGGARAEENGHVSDGHDVPFDSRFDSGRSRHFVATGIEEILPGGIVQTAHGPVFAHERLYTDLGERPIPLLRRLAELEAPAGLGGEYRVDRDPADEPARAWSGDDSGPMIHTQRRRRRRARNLAEITGLHDPPERGLFRRFGHRRVLYMDIETCGLTAAPVFLVGLCFVGERNLVLRQLFARDYAEERALLAELSRITREVDFLVTFNGKSFDVPFLRDRAIRHRLDPLAVMPHLDLLWMARRRWKGLLPDCRLKTIEWRVLRRRRAGDVGGAEIPGLYHDYVKRGEAHRLLPVFHHNLLDVVAMVELTPVIFDPEVRVY